MIKRYGPDWLTSDVEITERPDGEYVRFEDHETVERDAARYRWLRDGHGYCMEENCLCGFKNEKAEADLAIDEAMKESGQ